MNRYKFTFLIFLFCVSSAIAQDANEGMDNEQMDEIIREIAQSVDGELGGWQIDIQDRMVLMITDERANRMRIFTPVIEVAECDKAVLELMLEANFHSALDAKYSIYEGLVISVFTHPLKELTREQLVDALKQVVNLADTFGTTFSSTDVIFNPGIEPAEESQEPVKETPINKRPGGKGSR